MASELSTLFEKKFKLVPKVCESEEAAKASTKKGLPVCLATALSSATARGSSSGGPPSGAGPCAVSRYSYPNNFRRRNATACNARGFSCTARMMVCCVAVMDKKYQALQEQVEWMKKEMESLMSNGRSSTGGARRKVDRQMSFEEKRKLSVNIGNLPQDKVGRVVQIIRQKMPQLASGEVPPVAPAALAAALLAATGTRPLDAVRQQRRGPAARCCGVPLCACRTTRSRWTWMCSTTAACEPSRNMWRSA